MKIKKHSKEWFDKRLQQIRSEMTGYDKVLTHTKGFKANGGNKKLKKISSLLKFAAEKKIKLDIFK